MEVGWHEYLWFMAGALLGAVAIAFFRGADVPAEDDISETQIDLFLNEADRVKRRLRR